MGNHMTLGSTKNEIIFTVELPEDLPEDSENTYLLRKAIEEKIDLSHVYLAADNYFDVDFSGLNLSHADISCCHFYACNFERTDLSEAVVTDIGLDDCDTTGWKLPTRLLDVPQGGFSIWKVVGNNVVTSSEFEGYKLYILLLEVDEYAERVVAAGSPYRIRVDRATPRKLFTLDGDLIISPQRFSVYPPQIASIHAYVENVEYLPDGFNPDMFKACSKGINGFLTFDEARTYAFAVLNASEYQ